MFLRLLLWKHFPMSILRRQCKSRSHATLTAMLSLDSRKKTGPNYSTTFFLATFENEPFRTKWFTNCLQVIQAESRMTENIGRKGLSFESCLPPIWIRMLSSWPFHLPTAYFVDTVKQTNDMHNTRWCCAGDQAHLFETMPYWHNNAQTQLVSPSNRSCERLWFVLKAGLAVTHSPLAQLCHYARSCVYSVECGANTTHERGAI